MAKLLLGPVLRHVGDTDATVWVETDSPCEVAIRDAREPTFCVAGHHYAIVVVSGLTPGEAHPYDVSLDGELAWPVDGEPQPRILAVPPSDEIRVAFGSCRVSLPNEPPYTDRPDDDDLGHEVDALAALARRLHGASDDEWPDVLVLVGDQVYADELSPQIEAQIAERSDRPPGVPKGEVADFEEYTWLYRESWADPAIRRLFASLPTAMIFDDHDVHDDWNTSGTWIREQREKHWWRERVIGAYASYWVYQHLGNLPPDELEADATLKKVKASPEDATQILRDFAARAVDEVASTRWSFRRDLGSTRLVVLDSRAGRIVDDDSDRRMLSDEQWEWVSEQLTGDVDHLLIATSLPAYMLPGLHDVEAWNEAVCAGAWGGGMRKLGEKMRQGADLEHWASFEACFRRLTRELEAVGSGQRGKAPASIVLLSGDVHHAYVAELGFPRGANVTSAVVQAVCSPVRNPLSSREQLMFKVAMSRPAELVARGLARLAGVKAPPVRWRLPEPPTFDNQVATLELAPGCARLKIEKTLPEEWREPVLHTSLDRMIASA